MTSRNTKLLRHGGKRAGAGRKPGTPNKLSANVKAAILGAFEQAGGQAYLLAIAKSDPRTFCTLLGKILPTQLEAPATGEQHLLISWLDEIDGLTRGLPSDRMSDRTGDDHVGS